MDILEIVKFHKKKFNKATLEIQELKCLQEIAEFQCATKEKEKVEEAIDVIISMIGFVSKLGYDVEKELSKKIIIINSRKYDEKDYDHIEKENLRDEW